MTTDNSVAEHLTSGRTFEEHMAWAASQMKPGLTDEAAEQIEATMPKCTRCGGLIHSVDECSLNEEMPTCIYCSKSGHWSQSCPEFAA